VVNGNSESRKAGAGSPKDAAADVFGRAQQVMVIVPIDADINEAEHVLKKIGTRAQGGQIAAVRHFQFQHHDRNDDGQHAVAEGFETSFGMSKLSKLSGSRRAGALRSGRRGVSARPLFSMWVTALTANSMGTPVSR